MNYIFIYSVFVDNVLIFCYILMMKFTLSGEQYANVMRYYSPVGELNGKLALAGLKKDYDIVFSSMVLEGGYIFKANDPKKYAWFVLKHT